MTTQTTTPEEATVHSGFDSHPRGTQTTTENKADELPGGIKLIDAPWRHWWEAPIPAGIIAAILLMAILRSGVLAYDLIFDWRHGLL